MMESATSQAASAGEVWTVAILHAVSTNTVMWVICLQMHKQHYCKLLRLKSVRTCFVCCIVMVHVCDWRLTAVSVVIVSLCCQLYVVIWSSFFLSTTNVCTFHCRCILCLCYRWYCSTDHVLMNLCAFDRIEILSPASKPAVIASSDVSIKITVQLRCTCEACAKPHGKCCSWWQAGHVDSDKFLYDFPALRWDTSTGTGNVE